MRFAHSDLHDSWYRDICTVDLWLWIVDFLWETSGTIYINMDIIIIIIIILVIEFVIKYEKKEGMDFLGSDVDILTYG